tara:strand:- start:38623 stop:39489 length:867 start_codon:yes stop_codon:yes gene_type:complete
MILFDMHQIYRIHDTEYINNQYKEYETESTFPEFQNKLEEFKNILKKFVNEKQTNVFYKFGDGDYHFLTKSKIGSAKPGNRAIKKPYIFINHKEFVRNAHLNDFYMCELITQNQNNFQSFFKKDMDYPAEYVYGLIANKWLLKNFSGKIGLIGAEPKLELIQLLLNKEEYKNYLGIDSFNDYISIPQKFAVDNLSRVKKDLKTQLNNSTAEIYFLGVGHVKSALFSELKKYKKAVYLDIGTGIDALAGIIDKNRPYFGLWKNYKLKDSFDYSKIDYLSHKKIIQDKII